MTRAEMKTYLIEELGIENPTNLQITNLLNKFNEENKSYASASKDYVSREEHQRVLDELTKHKDVNAKNERHQKYQKAKIDESFYDFVDSKLKESKDFDKDLADFAKNNPKFLITESSDTSPKQQQGGAFVFNGGMNQSQADNGNDWKSAFNKGMHDIFRSE